MGRTGHWEEWDNAPELQGGCKTDRCSLLLDWFQTKHSCWFSASPWSELLRTVGVAFPSGMQKRMKKKLSLWKKANFSVQGGFYVIPYFVSLVGKNVVCFWMNEKFHSGWCFSVTLLKNSSERSGLCKHLWATLLPHIFTKMPCLSSLL